MTKLSNVAIAGIAAAAGAAIIGIGIYFKGGKGETSANNFMNYTDPSANDKGVLSVVPSYTGETRGGGRKQSRRKNKSRIGSKKRR